jgi:hypothetical protein
MSSDPEAQIKRDLLSEIQILDQNYRVIAGFVAGQDYDPATIGTSSQSFKNSLNRSSAYVLALYNLRGQRVTIPWETLFTNLDFALATLSGQSATLKQRDAVRSILGMSQNDIRQVLNYFAALKESLK